MKVAFITTLDLDDLSDLPDQARGIEEALIHAGYEVVSVAPWQRPSLSPEQTTTTTNPIITTTNPIIQNG